VDGYEIVEMKPLALSSPTGQSGPGAGTPPDPEYEIVQQRPALTENDIDVIRQVVPTIISCAPRPSN